MYVPTAVILMLTVSLGCRDEQVSGARIRELVESQPAAEVDPTTEQLLAERQQQPQVGPALV